MSISLKLICTTTSIALSLGTSISAVSAQTNVYSESIYVCNINNNGGVLPDYIPITNNCLCPASYRRINNERCEYVNIIKRVPEPGTVWGLLSLGVLGLTCLLRKNSGS
jgi:hypothetical protein